MTKLSPSQQEAYSDLLEAFPIGSIFVVWTPDGLGKTTLLEEFHRNHKKSVFLNMKNYIDDLAKTDPFRMEETFEALVMDSLKKADVVILDDLHLLYAVICGCGYGDSYPRAKFIEAVLTTICAYVTASGKKLVIGNEGGAPGPIAHRCYYAGFSKFQVEDYAAICGEYLGKSARKLDFKKIHRFAPKLNAHQLKSVAFWFKGKTVDTETFIEYLRQRRMASNVDLGEVEAIDLHSLRGLDDIIESLEANIIVPLEHDDLSVEFGIRPKRGVLLAGPPGTGKTTVGRALAHRLKSKFFLIDGTFISGTDDFYRKISRVFEAAKQNAPSIIFIDDSDIIFENKEDFGLYRYLLTMLDGLEGESNKRICVMMTTMDVASVPAALIRSGRIELWLETRLPDRDARTHILNDHANKLPKEIRPTNLDSLADVTDGLTGADLRRLIEDGKILIAYDKARKIQLADINSYFVKAVDGIRKNKEIYADAENKSRAKAEDEPSSELSSMMRMAMRSLSALEDD